MSAAEWRPVVGFEVYYEVSSLGQVRSVTRTITKSNGVTQTYKGRGRVLHAGTGGYLGATLVRYGKRHPFMVHTLVAEAFHGPRPEGLWIRHFNGVQEDNRAENLAYGTASENALDKTPHGTDHYRSRTHCPRGHAHGPENVVAAHAREGMRKCKACNRAGARIQHQGGGDMQEVSDQYYAEIIAGMDRVAA